MESHEHVSRPAPDALPSRVELAFYNEAQTAALTGLSKSYLAKARMRGDGPPYSKIGRRVLYSKPDIDRWIRARIRLSTSEVWK